MATLTTKYSIGDVVWHATTTTETKQHPCPDCKGEKQWKASSPAGDEFTFACPRCSARYQSNDALSLNYTVFVPIARCMTIGQVEAKDGGAFEVRYMCRETGVGSGSVYNEDRLFPTEAEAMAAAAQIAAADNAHPESWVAQRYNRSLDLCDYQLTNALKKDADDKRIKFDVRVQMLFEDLREAEAIEDVKFALNRYDERMKEAA